MKTLFLYPLFLLSSLLLAEGTNTGSVVDPSKVPVFNTCTDIADIVGNKPSLLPTYTAVLADTGKAAYSIKGPVSIDVKTGTIQYNVYSSLNGDIAEKPTFTNNLCIKADPVALNQQITQDTQAIREEIQKMYEATDKIYDEAKAESEQSSDGKTQSDVIGQALSGNVDEAQASEAKVQKYGKSNTQASRESITSPQFGFMARINRVNNELQTLIYLGIVFITVIGLGAGFITKKLQKRQDHEDYLARAGLGIVLTFLLFANANTYKYGAGEISQTRMQSIWGWVLNKGTGVANELAGAAHHQQMKTAVDKSGGQELQKQITEAVTAQAELENKEGAYEQILHQCVQSYRVNDLMMAIGDKKGGGKRYFPTDESQVKMGDENVYSRYLMPSVNQEGNYVSLSSCGKAEAEYRILVKQKAELKDKIENGKHTELAKNYTFSSRQAIADTTKAGWIGIAMLPIHHFVANGIGNKLEQKIHPASDLKAQEDKLDCSTLEWGFSDGIKKAGCYLEKIVNYVDPFELIETFKTLSFDDYLQSIATRAPMLIVPGAQPIASLIQDQVGKLPIPGAGFFGGIIGFYIGSDIGLIVVQNLPFLVLIPAISIVIALYYAEVFLYSITIPYIAAYAFSRDQWGHLVKHAVRGIMIALKPAMIVISVYTSIYVSDIISKISTDMINKQTSILIAKEASNHPTVGFYDSIKNSMFKITKGQTGSHIENGQMVANPNSGYTPNGGGAIDNSIDGLAYLSGKFTIYIIQGFLLMIMAVVQVFIVIKIIISGPAMIMEMFGIRETDMASQMTESISSGAKKYEGGI